MISYYLHFISDFWYSSASKLVQWLSQSLFVKKLLTTMALTKKRYVMNSKRDEEDEMELGLGSVRFTRGLGRKRILISSCVRQSLSKSAVEIPVTESPSLRSQRNRALDSRLGYLSKSAADIPTTESSLAKNSQQGLTLVSSSSSSSPKSRLESLPQELLIRVICGVDHEDLMSLYLVSKSIKEASLIAKKLHFAFTTPKKVRAFRNPIEISDSSNQEEDLEAPNAPNHYRWTQAKRKEQLSSVSMALFT